MAGKKYIQAGDVRGMSSEIAGNDPRSAGDVEHRVVRLDIRALDHQLQQVFMAIFVPPQERFCLPGKLIEDFGVVLH